jgi:hypothetical protein
MGRELALDNVISAAQFFVREWSPDLTRTQARDLLRFLICRWYDAGRGHFVGTQVKLSQGTLARKLGISRQWCGVLAQRLRDVGWLAYYSELLPDGMRGSCIFRIGGQFKRMLVMLKKTGRPKSAAKPADKSAWKFSPSLEEKEILLRRQKENRPPPEEVLQRIPLLRQWMRRG